MPKYVYGAQEIINNLNRTRIVWLGRIANAVESSLVDASNHAKAGHESNQAHMNKRYANQTSTLTRSINPNIDKVTVNGVEGHIGTNVEYAPFLEYGTSRNRAYPFLFPALVAVKHIFLKRLKIAMSRIL